MTAMGSSDSVNGIGDNFNNVSVNTEDDDSRSRNGKANDRECLINDSQTSNEDMESSDARSSSGGDGDALKINAMDVSQNDVTFDESHAFLDGTNSSEEHNKLSPLPHHVVDDNTRADTSFTNGSKIIVRDSPRNNINDYFNDFIASDKRYSSKTTNSTSSFDREAFHRLRIQRLEIHNQEIPQRRSTSHRISPPMNISRASAVTTSSSSSSSLAMESPSIISSKARNQVSSQFKDGSNTSLTIISDDDATNDIAVAPKRHANNIPDFKSIVTQSAPLSSTMTSSAQQELMRLGKKYASTSSSSWTLLSSQNNRFLVNDGAKSILSSLRIKRASSLEPGKESNTPSSLLQSPPIQTNSPPSVTTYWHSTTASVVTPDDKSLSDQSDVGLYNTRHDQEDECDSVLDNFAAGDASMSDIGSRDTNRINEGVGNYTEDASYPSDALGSNYLLQLGHLARSNTSLPHILPAKRLSTQSSVQQEEEFKDTNASINNYGDCESSYESYPSSHTSLTPHLRMSSACDSHRDMECDADDDEEEQEQNHDHDGEKRGGQSDYFSSMCQAQVIISKRDQDSPTDQEEDEENPHPDMHGYNNLACLLLKEEVDVLDESFHSLEDCGAGFDTTHSLTSVDTTLISPRGAIKLVFIIVLGAFSLLVVILYWDHIVEGLKQALPNWPSGFRPPDHSHQWLHSFSMSTFSPTSLVEMTFLRAKIAIKHIQQSTFATNFTFRASSIRPAMVGLYEHWTKDIDVASLILNTLYRLAKYYYDFLHFYATAKSELLLVYATNKDELMSMHVDHTNTWNLTWSTAVSWMHMTRRKAGQNNFHIRPEPSFLLKPHEIIIDLKRSTTTTPVLFCRDRPIDTYSLSSELLPSNFTLPCSAIFPNAPNPNNYLGPSEEQDINVFHERSLTPLRKPSLPKFWISHKRATAFIPDNTHRILHSIPSFGTLPDWSLSYSVLPSEPHPHIEQHSHSIIGMGQTRLAHNKLRMESDPVSNIHKNMAALMIKHKSKFRKKNHTQQGQHNQSHLAAVKEDTRNYYTSSHFKCVGPNSEDAFAAVSMMDMTSELLEKLLSKLRNRLSSS